MDGCLFGELAIVRRKCGLSRGTGYTVHAESLRAEPQRCMAVSRNSSPLSRMYVAQTAWDDPTTAGARYSTTHLDIFVVSKRSFSVSKANASVSGLLQQCGDQPANCNQLRLIVSETGFGICVRALHRSPNWSGRLSLRGAVRPGVIPGQL